MLYSISKLVWPFISPQNFILLLFILALFFSIIKRRSISKFLSISAISLFLILGFFPIGPNLLTNLEGSYSRPESLQTNITGIIVMGGAVETETSRIRKQPILNEGAERIFEAIALKKQHPEALIIFSGGQGDYYDNGDLTEAMVSEKILLAMGWEDDLPIYEDSSRNTFENVTFTKELLIPYPGETWLIVTSAYHMKRTMAVFESTHWPGNIVPWPVDYRTSGDYYFIGRNLDVAGNMYKLQLYLHETLGILFYKMTGKI